MIDNYDFSLFEDNEDNLDNYYVYCYHTNCEKNKNGHCTFEECIELDENDWSCLSW